MRLVLITTAAIAALTLAACGRDADTTDDAMTAEDAAVDASATTGGAGGSSAGGGEAAGYAAPNMSDAGSDAYQSGSSAPQTPGATDDVDRANAQAEAEQTNLRPRPDVTGPQ